MNQMLSSSLRFTVIKSMEMFPMLKMKKSTEQRWPGRKHSTQLLFGKQVKKDSAQHHAVPTDRTILRLEVGRQFSQFPTSAFLSKLCLFFSIPADCRPCHMILDLNPHKKNNLALLIYSVIKGIT